MQRCIPTVKCTEYDVGITEIVQNVVHHVSIAAARAQVLITGRCG